MIVSNKHNHTFFILIYLLQSHSFPFELGVDYSSPHRQEIRPLVVCWHLSDMSVRSKLYHTDPVQMTAERYSFLGDKIRKKKLAYSYQHISRSTYLVCMDFLAAAEDRGRAQHDWAWPPVGMEGTSWRSHREAGICSTRSSAQH